MFDEAIALDPIRAGLGRSLRNAFQPPRDDEFEALLRKLGKK